MGLKEKRKGERGERIVRDKLRELGFPDVSRGSVFQGTSDLVGIPGIHPEVKFCEKVKLWEFYDQACEEAEKRKDGVPTVFIKRSRSGILVVQAIEHWAPTHLDHLKYRELLNYKELVEEEDGE